MKPPLYLIDFICSPSYNVLTGLPEPSTKERRICLMTDSEKRAHDLAITMIAIHYDRDFKGTSKTGGDVYEIYFLVFSSF